MRCASCGAPRLEAPRREPPAGGMLRSRSRRAEARRQGRPRRFVAGRRLGRHVGRRLGSRLRHGLQAPRRAMRWSAIRRAFRRASPQARPRPVTRLRTTVSRPAA
ncbi:hypothetical protein GSH10_09995 [Burkholderia pseudomallei]|nr:hypothetical protein [Burkholderia pseudomallei]MBM5666394.1 hypothetical protein [Burkholderia pseudomallei]